jgi:hypothetical protein
MPVRVLPPKRAALGALVLCCLAVHACGPSFEAIQEGDLRFAHCDRLDLDPNIAPSHRLHCWREWRRVYTYAQTRDRVEYAQRRIAEVVSGDTRPAFYLPSGPQTAQAGVRFESPGADPSLRAPDPAGAAPLNGAAVDTLTSQPAPPEQLECRARCEAALAACAPGCETKPTGCQPCDPGLDTCLADCSAPRP